MAEYSRRPGMKGIDTGVRKVAPTYGRAAVVTHVDKGGGTLVFESNAERLVARLFGLDPRVLHFQRQPFTVDLIERRILRSAEERKIARKRYASISGPSLYTPDFNVEHGNSRFVAVEVKLTGFRGQEADHERMNRAAEVLTAHGIEFHRVHVPDELAHPLHTNTNLLYQALLRTDVRPKEEVMTRVERLADAGALTVADYIKGLEIPVSYLPTLLVHGVLAMDVVTRRIEGRTPAEPAYGNLEHLQILERLLA